MGAAGASAASLIERCSNRTALVGVIGLGYVGLPLALRFSEAGFRVIGFDIDRAKAEAIASGRSYFLHIPHAAVAAARERGIQAADEVAPAASAPTAPGGDRKGTSPNARHYVI